MSGPHRAALILCAAMSLSAPSAQALVVDFAGNGVVNGPAQTPPVFTGLTIGPGDASYTLGGQTGWAIDVVFGGNLTPSGGFAGAMAGKFLRGADSLIFTGTQNAAVLGEPIALAYTVTGGTGAFAGYIGSGISTVVLMGNPFGLPTPVPFQEFGGRLTLQAVPEPGSWALVATALGMLLWPARRTGTGRKATLNETTP